MDELLSPQELSEFLGVPMKSLANWRVAHYGPVGIRVGKHIRYPRKAVEEWIAQQVAEEQRRRSA